MAKPETPKSRATIRAEQRADKARITFLKRQWQDEKRARGEYGWRTPKWLVHHRKMDEIDAELRTLRSKKYG